MAIITVSRSRPQLPVALNGLGAGKLLPSLRDALAAQGITAANTVHLKADAESAAVHRREVLGTQDKITTQSFVASAQGSSAASNNILYAVGGVILGIVAAYVIFK